MKRVKRVLKKFWGWMKPYFTPRMIPIILSVWCITNGIWYVLAFVPLGLPEALVWAARGYLVFIWSPLGIEKPIIIIVSLFIYRLIYREKFIKK